MHAARYSLRLRTGFRHEQRRVGSGWSVRGRRGCGGGVTAAGRFRAAATTVPAHVVGRLHVCGQLALVPGNIIGFKISVCRV